MAKKTSEPQPIENAVTLDDLRQQSEILAPDMPTMLGRFGFGSSIGENYAGEAAVPIETAAEFLGKLESAKNVKSRRWTAYQAYLQERRAEIAAKRREKAQKQREALIARGKKVAESAAKAKAKAKAEAEAVLAAEAAKNADEEPLTFDEWQANNGD